MESVNSIKKLAVFLLWFSFGILLVFIVVLCSSIEFDRTKDIDLSAVGQVGDFIGGVVGSIWALAGILFIYATFQQQNIIISRDLDKFLFENFIAKLTREFDELGYKKEQFQQLSDKIEEFKNSQSIDHHSSLVLQVNQNYHFYNEMNPILTSAISHIEKFNDDEIKKLFVEQLLIIFDLKSHLTYLDNFELYMGILDSSFRTADKEEGQLLFEFKGEQLLNTKEDSYIDKARLFKLSQDYIKAIENSSK
jgi:hypothetical protein